MLTPRDIHLVGQQYAPIFIAYVFSQDPGVEPFSQCVETIKIYIPTTHGNHIADI